MTGRPSEDDEPVARPTPSLARRDFFGSFAALALLVSACGGGGGNDMPPAASPAPAPPAPSPPAPAPPAPSPPAPSPSPALTCGAVAISDNHGHTLTIPAADVDSATFKTYSIAGGADHNHTITLLPVQLAQIKAGTAVTVMSTSVGSTTYFEHSHQVTVNCS
jgi:hypothetical protein